MSQTAHVLISYLTFSWVELCHREDRDDEIIKTNNMISR
jgi:hypothetical protein